MPEDIRLTPDGGVKILAIEMIGHENMNNQLSSLSVLAYSVCQILKLTNEPNSVSKSQYNQSHEATGEEKSFSGLSTIKDFKKVISEISTYECS